MSDERLREQLVRTLDWEEAHVGFDKGVDGIPPDKRGAHAPGLEHTCWQLLEHMRLALADLLDFCTNAKYVHNLKWPDDYWPKAPSPATVEAWDRSIAAFKRDLEKLKEVVRETDDLYALVPTGKGRQTYLRTILVVIDHNAYHLGQIIAVRRALGVWG
jgi:uncharacterized damage-inducible protein DinB